MKLTKSRIKIFGGFAAIALVAAVAGPCLAQPPGGPPRFGGGTYYGGSRPSSNKVETGIVWYGVLQDGLDEAKRTGKPILLMSAAPQCAGVPGMW